MKSAKGEKIMTSKKSSWEYQKDRYLQLNIKFKCDNSVDMRVYQYLKENNASETIKRLVLTKIDPCYGCMGASFNDCEVCSHGR